MRGVFAFTLAVALLAARPSFAQTDAEIATRRLLLERAEQARSTGDHATALRFAFDAGRIGMSPSLRVFLAEEHAALGHYAESLGEADACVREAQHDPNLHNRDSIMARCHELSSAARAHVGSIVVHIADPHPDGLRVLINGTPIADALIGLPYAVTSGPVTIEASAPGRETVRQSMTVAPSGNAETSITLPASATPTQEVSQPASSGPPTVASASPAPASPAPTATTSVRNDEGSRVGAGPVVLLGAGALLFIGSGVFYFLQTQATPSCRSGSDAMGSALLCPNSAMSEVSTMQTYNVLTNVALGLGAAAVIAGGVWLVLDLRRGSEHRNVSLDLGPTRDGGMLLVRGRF